MEILKKFSLADWFKQVGSACRRFPVAVLLLAFLAGYVICLAHDVGYDEKWTFFYVFYPATGALLAVSLRLLTEDFRNRFASVLTQVVVHALWLGVSLYLTQIENFSLPQVIAVCATVVAMVLSLFLACFYRKGDDVPFWNFAWRTLAALLAGVIVGGVLTLGIILFAQSLDWLFGVKIDEAVFVDIPAVCMVLVAPLLAMSQIPEGDAKHDRRVVNFSGFLKGVVQYLFIPLLLLYMATLYVYAAKILFSWQLPVGWVCYLVSASMLGMVVLLFITYPVQHEQRKSFFKALTRWLPLAMLPLLALMSVAIGRRLSDYGITVSRLYVVVFNLWCYAVCIGLLLSRNKRIWWVPASFAAILFLISVGPWSIPNVTEHRLRGELREAFTASGVKELPLTGDQYDKWLHSVDEKVARSADAKLAYLQRDFGYGSTRDLVGKDAVVGPFSRLSSDGDVVSEPMHYHNFRENLMSNARIPHGYAHMSAVDVNNVELVEQRGNFLVLEVHDWIVETVSTCRFEATLNQFVERDAGRSHYNSVEPLILDNGSEALVVENFNLSLQNDSVLHIDVSGILLTK